MMAMVMRMKNHHYLRLCRVGKRETEKEYRTNPEFFMIDCDAKRVRSAEQP
jgi:hypothetical protein